MPVEGPGPNVEHTLLLPAHVCVCVCVCVSHSVVSDSFVATQTVACQTFLSMEFSRPGILEWVAFPFSRGSSQPRDHTVVSCITGRFLTS